MTKLEVAQQFGSSLDSDDFASTHQVVAKDCVYHIGTEILNGANDIVASYEDNMIEGRKKFDEIVWGKCRIEALSENEFYVHFKDVLRHKGREHVYCCKQKLTVGDDLMIHEIVHVDSEEEVKALRNFKDSVGIE